MLLGWLWVTLLADVCRADASVVFATINGNKLSQFTSDHPHDDTHTMMTRRGRHSIELWVLVTLRLSDRQRLGYSSVCGKHIVCSSPTGRFYAGSGQIKTCHQIIVRAEGHRSSCSKEKHI